MIGTSELVRAAPDGYTLAYGNIVSLATNRSLLASVPYDVDRDLTLVSMTWRVVNMIVVNSNLPVATVPELVAYARKSPGRLAFASDGNGTTAHLGMELFKSMTGTYMLHVPYRGAVSGLADVMAGGVQVMMANTPVVAPHVESGKLRALGITSPKRSAAYPDLPAVAESIPGFEVTAWGGIVAPANLPADIVNRLNAEIRVALASSAVLERFQKLGAEAVASTPEEFRELSRRETAKWAGVMQGFGRQAGLSVARPFDILIRGRSDHRRHGRSPLRRRHRHAGRPHRTQSASSRARMAISRSGWRPDRRAGFHRLAHARRPACCSPTGDMTPKVSQGVTTVDRVATAASASRHAPRRPAARPRRRSTCSTPRATGSGSRVSRPIVEALEAEARGDRTARMSRRPHDVAGGDAGRPRPARRPPARDRDGCASWCARRWHRGRDRRLHRHCSYEPAVCGAPRRN